MAVKRKEREKIGKDIKLFFDVIYGKARLAEAAAMDTLNAVYDNFESSGGKLKEDLTELLDKVLKFDADDPNVDKFLEESFY